MSTKKQPRRKRLHLYLLDDNTNSFEYVINVLVHVCNMNALQAEQCALLTHSTGKSHIHTSLNGMETIVIYETLLRSGLNIELSKKKL
jgi:ATP-dependent Clp protease adaptor protein ClpS